MTPPSRTLHFASVLPHSDNRRTCGFAFGYAPICSAYASQTFHTRRQLSEIGIQRIVIKVIL